ncbi:MAG: excinuclease ABC subunit UvrB [Candidatus Paceibacterota bacterium]
MDPAQEFKLVSKYKPAGDQPEAIEALVKGVKKGNRFQTLLGVTGSGKTFTAANVIKQIGKPTLVIAHNKTLAAQLAQEYREFFPENAVHYFVSYYDYYQPEAYMPVSDTYIEKEAQINIEIERLRHATTQALLTRKDVIIVASVSCIYGLGSPEEYEKVNLKISVGDKISRNDLARKLIDIHFDRTNADLTPGLFRALGNTVEIMPVSEKIIFKIDFVGEEISKISKVDYVTRNIIEEIKSFFLFPAKHFITQKEDRDRAIKTIKAELEKQLKVFEKEKKPLEAERIKRRTNYDLALIREVGYCNGIENYSRHFSGKKEGEAPDTLLSYFPTKRRTIQNEHGQTQTIVEPDFLTIIDESHVTVPQIGGMYAGDASRKKTLVDYGFRLPSAKDNRPLKFNEFEERVGQVIFTSATPSVFEKENSSQVVEQVIRPTGLIDPKIEIKPIFEKKGQTRLSSPAGSAYGGQVKDFITEAKREIKKGFRAIGTTLTKKMAEDLSEYLKEQNIKAEYLHSEILTIDRITILTDFRKGKFDVLIGVNLLREGLDLPEVSLIGIFDADKQGFLRSETSLIQIIGRAARNTEGRVILYAEHETDAMKKAISETERRRVIQVAYNVKNKITPKTIIKKIQDITDMMQSEHDKTVKEEILIGKKMLEKNPREFIRSIEKEMEEAVKELDFETAAILRDEIKEIYKKFPELIVGGKKKNHKK